MTRNGELREAQVSLHWNPRVNHLLQMLTWRTGLTFPPDRHQSALDVIESVSDCPLEELPADSCKQLVSRPESRKPLMDELTIEETYFSH